MGRDARYDILFEPVKIGPVTAKNRFFQVPHCNGLGYRDPTAGAVMRGIKAEGGWAVVCTEQADVHHSSDITPFIEQHLWDDRDMPALSRVAEQVHRHGALAGIELVHSGMNGSNLYTREIPIAPSATPIITFYNDPVQARAMDKQDIADLRRWYRNAALRCRKMEFDLVCIYAAHGFGAPQHFLSRRFNRRGDEYGGSLENRTRLLREITEDVKSAIGDRCAVSVRVSMDELIGPAGLHKEEMHDAIGLMAELPDLWDLTLSGWDNDSGTSRFAEEGFQEPYVAGIKKLTTKPVVGVGRFTSPDTMVSQIRRGILDFIGAARPSIADPFLPRKIEEGRLEDIRECIGCNMCITGDMTMSPSRCTQNPTMGEEWRKGWHPELIRGRESDGKVLIVGGGPAGLECARALGRRGYQVALAEAGQELGGRVSRESRLPGLSAWARVRDYRLQQLKQMTNVETYLDSRLSGADVLEYGFEHVVIATGGEWRRDGTARHHQSPLAIDSAAEILTPDDIFAGKRPHGGRVVIYDDDHFYLGSVLAELMVKEGHSVVFVTPAAEVANWTRNTLEQEKIQTRLLKIGVEIASHRAVTRIDNNQAELTCVFTGRIETVLADSVLLVTARNSRDELYRDLRARQSEWDAAGIRSVRIIGDANAPGTIAAAVYAGHRYAQELDAPEIGDGLPFKREIAELLPL
ncbi:MAG: FAD-dependent oxidoreductase [Dongiaceae bacterium]